MVYYLILCRSLTYAQKTSRILEQAGIRNHIVRTPKRISAEGCGYCIKVSERTLTSALVQLKQNNLPPKQIYIHYEDDTYDEVEP